MTNDEAVQILIRELNACLEEYQESYQSLSWRDKVLMLVQAGITFKELGKHTDPEAAKVGARERIRLYLIRHVGVVISASELEVVSGISEYARRVRELRVEDGYKILTGNSNDPDIGLELSPNEYTLISPEPDSTAAHRWHMINRIRRDRALGSQAKILAFLKANVGEIVTTEELSYVSGNARQYARRTRELRTEQGFAIATLFTGRPDLNMGEYILESLDRIAEPHDRNIPFHVQRAVYERDNNTCRLCGWNRSCWSREDPRILELHHVIQHADGGHNEPGNLIVLCSRCHDGIHAGRLDLPEGIVQDGE